MDSVDGFLVILRVVSAHSNIPPIPLRVNGLIPDDPEFLS